MSAPLLEILSGDLTGRRYAVDDREFLIGRSPLCDIVIPKRYISREHARIVRDQDRWLIDGLSQTNPVLVRGRPISEYPLRDGDEFEMCGIRFRFRAGKNGDAGGAPKPGPRRSGVVFGLGSEAERRARGGSWRDDDAPAGLSSEPGDGWRDDEASDADDWRRDPGAPPSIPLVGSTPGQVVFEVEDEEDEGEKTGELPLQKLSSLSARSGSTAGSSAERTSELPQALDPDDPNYDPFAQVEATKKKVRSADPFREKMLKVLIGVGMVAIVLAFLIMQKLEKVGPPSHELVKDPITLALGQTVEFEEPWAPNDRPSTHAVTQLDGTVPQQNYLLRDPAEIEWVAPSLRRRTILLIRGVNQGKATFSLRFPHSNRIKTWTIIVSGADPHDVARDKRKAAFAKKSFQDLRHIVRSALASGDAYKKERDSPGKESYYRQAALQYAIAADAANALSDKLAKQGLPNQDALRVVRDCEKRETDARRDRDVFLQHQEAIYQSMVDRQVARADLVMQLERVLRIIDHTCDVRFKRYTILLRDCYQVTPPEIERCPYDVSR